MLQPVRSLNGHSALSAALRCAAEQQSTQLCPHAVQAMLNLQSCASTLCAVWWRDRVRCTPRCAPPRPIGVGSTMLIAISPPSPVGVP